MEISGHMAEQVKINLIKFLKSCDRPVCPGPHGGNDDKSANHIALGPGLGCPVADEEGEFG